MKRLLQHLLLIFGLTLIAACGGGGNDGSPPPDPGTALRVKVLDVLGFAKAGAVVEVVGAGMAAVTTGADGLATVDLPAATDRVLKVSLPGHTEQFRPVRVTAGESAYLQVELMARAPALTLPDAAAGGTLVGRNAARLTLPANALVDAESGAPVTGAVQVEMTPVNTASHEISAFPGSLRGVSAGTEGLLATYGPVEYVFTQGGRRLALATGQSAVIEMPLHATLDTDGTPLAVGESMPVWSLDEATGMWTQEGEGTIVASASATGLALRAIVTHFSWWNPDKFDDDVRINISFVFEGGLVPTSCCDVTAETTFGFPGPAGVASTTLPASGGSVVVGGGTFYTFTARGLADAGPLFGGLLDQQVPAGAGTLNLMITLKPDPDAPNPVITSPEAGVTTSTNSSSPLSVQASVSGGEPDLVELLADNSLIGPMTGSQQDGYTIAWDTAPFGEGSYDIRVRARRGDVTVTSTPRTVVVDRTPPVLVSRSPAPGADQVAASAAVTATFDEALDPDSLVNDAAPTVRLVTGTAPSATALPVQLALSEDGLTVTATPAAPLLTNTTYTVFVSGLTDLAGNAMAPVSWSFSVPVFALSSPDLRSTGPDGSFEGNVIGRPEIALASNGEPLVAWRQGTPEGRFTLRAARRIGALWVPLPVLPPVGVPNSAFGDQSMALDNTGQPVVAWTQTVPNVAGCNTTQPSQLFVARFNGSAWVQLGDGNLNIAPCSLPKLPRLKVDPQGRPVLVSAQGPLFGPTLQVLRFQGNEWTPLGSVPVNTAPSLPVVTELRLALDGSTPYVLRSESRAGNIGHFVARLEGSAFVPVGPQIATGNRDVRGALVFDPQGRPVVAVAGPSNTMLAARFDGTAWSLLVPGTVVDAAFAVSPLANEPSIVFEGNQPIVGWHDNLTAFARRFDPVTQDWGAVLTIKTDVGTLSELRRLPQGGPISGALTTGPFRRELRTVTTDTLP